MARVGESVTPRALLEAGQRHRALLLSMMVAGTAVGAAAAAVSDLAVGPASVSGEVLGLLLGIVIVAGRPWYEARRGARYQRGIAQANRDAATLGLPSSTSLSVASPPGRAQRPPGPRSSPRALVGRAVLALWDRPVWLVLAVILAQAWPRSSGTEGGAGVDVSPPDLASVALAGVVLARLLVAARPGLPVTLVRLFTLLIAAGLLSTIDAVDSDASLLGVVRYTQLFVVVPLAVVLSLRTYRDITLVLLAVVALGVGEGLLGVYQYVTETGAEYAGVATRAVGTFGAYNILSLAAVVSVAVLACLAFALASRGPVAATAGLVGFLLLVPLAFSLSRGSWLATAVAVLTVCVVFGRRRGAGVVLAGILGAALLVAVSPPESALQERVAALGQAPSQPDQSVRDRFALWSTAVEAWEDNPVTGVGLRNFPLHRDTYAPLALSSGSDIVDPGGAYQRVELLSPHNFYLLLLVEQGLVGALAYLLLWGLLGLAIVHRLLLVTPRRLTDHPAQDRGGIARIDAEMVAGLFALGYYCRYSVNALYSDFGGPLAVLDAVLLGVLVAVASGRLAKDLVT